METQLITDHCNALLVGRGAKEFLRADGGVSQGFLDEDITSGAYAGQRNRQMQAAGIANKSDVRLLCQCLIKAGKGANRILVFDVAAGVGAQGGRDYMHLSPDAIGNHLRTCTEQESQIARVALANATETDHENLHCLAPAASSIWLATHLQFLEIH